MTLRDTLRTLAGKAVRTLMPNLPEELSPAAKALFQHSQPGIEADEIAQQIADSEGARARLAPIKATVHVSGIGHAVEEAVESGTKFSQRVPHANPPRTAPEIKVYSNERLHGDRPRVPTEATGIKETAGRVL